jgi:hypothetical protein
MYNNHLSACGRAKNIQLPNTYVVKCPSKLICGTEKFTFDICLRFTHTYMDVNVQKINFNFKSTLPVYGKQELDLKVNAMFF